MKKVHFLYLFQDSVLAHSMGKAVNRLNESFWSIAYEGFVLYASTLYKWYGYKENLFQKYPWMRACEQRIEYASKYVFSKLQHCRIEPFSKNWISTSILMKTSNLSYDVLKGSRYIENEYIPFENNKENITETVLQDLSKRMSESSRILECMFVFSEKTSEGEERWMIRSFFPNEGEQEKSKGGPFVRKSDVKMLSVEYVHPSMRQSIFLELDKRIYWKHNVILSPLFVRRWLEYQPLPFVFDENYVLKIMDNNIHSMEIFSNQYIVLGDFDYSVCEIQPLATGNNL